MKKLLKIIVTSLSLSLMIVSIVYASAYTEAVDDSYDIEDDQTIFFDVRDNDTCTNPNPGAPGWSFAVNCEISIQVGVPANSGVLNLNNSYQFSYHWNQGGSVNDTVQFTYKLTNRSPISQNDDEEDTAVVTFTLDGEDGLPEFGAYVYMVTLLILFFLIFSFVAGPNPKYLNS